MSGSVEDEERVVTEMNREHGDGRGLTDEQQPAVAAFVEANGGEALKTALIAGVLLRNLRAESRWALEAAVSAGTPAGSTAIW